MDDVGKNVVRAAKEIIIRKQSNQADGGEETDVKIKNLQKNFDLKFTTIGTKIQSIENKIDLILKKLK